MTTIRVWHGGDGTDGLTWATAYQTLLAAVDSLTDANHTILVHYQHSETIAASVIYSGPLGVQTGVFNIITVDKDNSDVYTRATSPNITTTGTASDLKFTGCFNIKGMSFVPGDDFIVDIFSEEVFGGEELTVDVPSNGRVLLGVDQTVGDIRLVNCDLTVDYILYYIKAEIVGGSISGSRSYGVIKGYRMNSSIRLFGVDLTGVTGGILVDNYAGSTDLSIVGCKLPESVSILASGTERNIRTTLTASDDAVGNDIGRYEIHEVATGSITKSTGVYRTGGANDGSNDYSLLLSPGSYPHFADPLRTEWNEGYSAAGSVTVVAYINASSAVYNNDVWLEVMYFENATDTKMSLASTRVDSILDTPVVYPDDATSIWNGTSFTDQQTISISFSTGREGPFLWRLCSAVAVPVYLDPKIEVS